ncbi:MAG: DAK2 domain-containing protein [Lachnospiraceae bacterium]|nr:DAK2 domain-containing protein [Lachnospiraceae bacterium]
MDNVLAENTKLDGLLYAKLICGGASNLRRHVQEINDLNVFPIPDGDTGDNMLLTMMGGVEAAKTASKNLYSTARKAADGMLLSARGNSGVILSQFFDGIASGLEGLEEADVFQVGNALREGVKHAYESVLEPTEGTILTVAKDATEYACSMLSEGSFDINKNFISEAKRSLKRTPQLLPVLEKAHVVDSGGAGLVAITEGMENILLGKEDSEIADAKDNSKQPVKIALDAFTEDSVLEFGYCTELLIRLQNAKTDIGAFDTKIITDYMHGIGNSIVCYKTGSIVKLHVHTMTPDKVLAFCQQFGEFLNIKIENMSLQHNSLENEEKEEDDFYHPEQVVEKEHKDFAVVAVANGNGIIQAFKDLGADEVINGGQSMNPSAEDFIEAFDRANADTIFVLPNNSNIILAARQAAQMYRNSDVRVIESKSIGCGYAAMSMFDAETCTDASEIAEQMTDAMQGVVNASVSICVRDTDMDGIELHSGDYVGFAGKKILSCGKNAELAACALVDSLDFEDHEICILIGGADASAEGISQVRSHIEAEHPGCEIYEIDGGQDIYNYVIVLE